MLRGPRVTLRAFGREDLPTYWRHKNDVEIVLLADTVPPRPRSLEEMEANFEDQTRHPTGNPWWAIEADGRFIGQCLLHNFDHTSRNCELGITIGERDYWSKGYGRETVGLMLGHAFANLNMERVWLTVNARNERGLRCYAACGFLEEGRLRRHYWIGGAYDDAVYMGILKDEWEAKPVPQ